MHLVATYEKQCWATARVQCWQTIAEMAQVEAHTAPYFLLSQQLRTDHQRQTAHRLYKFCITHAGLRSGSGKGGPCLSCINNTRTS